MIKIYLPLLLLSVIVNGNNLDKKFGKLYGSN